MDCSNSQIALEQVLILKQDPRAPDIVQLLQAHLALMRSISPPECVHALDVDQLVNDSIIFWGARAQGTLLGCGALKLLGDGDGEIKSMHTAKAARGRGVGSLLLAAVEAEARDRGVLRLSLETGAQQEFAPAVQFYERHGFVPCGPFADYQPNPNSVFMRKLLS